jgi:L-alanine-DL-glutamate epimerase-like enolase superfamily enzyme
VGFLSSDIDTVIAASERSLARGMGGIKLKVGGEPREDVARVRAVRKALGDKVAIMVDANQAWDRATAKRVGRRLEEFDLTWIEEPVDAHDVAGHAALRDALDTPIASGEMLSSATDLWRLVEGQAVDVVQPDAVRIGGITPYRRISELADELNVTVAPHFATQLHVHLAACQPREGWVEWFDWLDPLFEERLEIRDGRVVVPNGPGLGLTLAARAREWQLSTAELPE